MSSCDTGRDGRVDDTAGRRPEVGPGERPGSVPPFAGSLARDVGSRVEPRLEGVVVAVLALARDMCHHGDEVGESPVDQPGHRGDRLLVREFTPCVEPMVGEQSLLFVDRRREFGREFCRPVVRLPVEKRDRVELRRDAGGDVGAVGRVERGRRVDADARARVDVVLDVVTVEVDQSGEHQPAVGVDTAVGVAGDVLADRGDRRAVRANAAAHDGRRCHDPRVLDDDALRARRGSRFDGRRLGVGHGRTSAW